jgi:hypothetical protein
MERKRLVLGVGSASLLMILLASWTFAQGRQCPRLLSRIR